MRLLTYFSVTSFSNCYLLGPNGPGEAVLIDPGVFDEGLLRLVEENRFRLRAILLTHAHPGHTAGVKTILKIYDVPIYALDPDRLSFSALPVRESTPLAVAGMRFRVLETPGHSNDSVCYQLDGLLFTGDTLSAGSVGNTPSPYQKALLLSSVRKKILPLAGHPRLFPGHGPPSTLEAEIQFNPFFRHTL